MVHLQTNSKSVKLHFNFERCVSSVLLDPETFFDLLAHTQSHRLDDQRVSLPSLPGLQKESNTSNGDSNYLCYMVSKVQVCMIL